MKLREDWKNILSKGGIGRKLAIYILIFSSVVTLLSTVMQLSLDYRHDVDAIEAEIAEVRDAYSLSLANSLWVTSKKDLQLQVDGILRLPDMQYLAVHSDTGEVQASAGTSKSSQTIAYEFPLHYSYRGKELTLGTLRVEASLLGVYERLKNKVVVILIAQGVKTFLVSFFILVLFQQLIGRHLNTLAQHFRATHTDAVAPELALDRKKGADVPHDELDVLVSNINDNAGRLKRANQNFQVAAQAVQLEKENLAITLNSIGDAVIATDVHGTITRMNPVAERLTGWPLADALGQPLATVFHIINAETRLRVANPVQLVLEHGQVVGLANHTALLARDGHEHQIADSAAPIHDATHAIVGVVLVFSDVTEKYRTEESLRVSNDHLQTTLKAIPDLLFEVDASGCVHSYHAHRSDLLAALPEVFMGKRFADVLPPAATEVCMNALNEAAVKGWSTGAIYALPLPQGETWFELSAAAMPVVAGALPRFILLARDITTRKTAEEALRANKERLKFLLSSSPAIIYTCEAKPPYAATYISENITALMGFHPDQFTGTPSFWADHVHPEDRQRTFDNLGELFDHGHHDHEYRFQMADGTYHWIFDRKKVVYSSDGEPEQLIGYWAGIDDMKRAEADLRKSEESHRQLFESKPHPMWVFDLETLAFIAVNDAAIRHYGYSRDEFLAMTIKDIRPPEDVPRLLDNLALVSEGIDGAGFWNHTTKDGRVITAEIVSHTLKFVGRNAELVLAHDVTKRKIAEKAIELALAEKTALLNEVHHRVKNNLQVISSLLRLESGRSGQPESKEMLKGMQSRIQSMALLHETLYRSGTFASVDLGSYIKQLATQSFRTMNMHTGAVRLEFDLVSVTVGLDQATPCGLLVNELVSNALKHGFPDAHGGEVRVTLSRVGTGNEVRLCVSDTGIGLPADFAQKSQRSLGLQLVSSLATQLGGVLDTGPEPEKGTIFSVTFSIDNPGSPRRDA